MPELPWASRVGLAYVLLDKQSGDDPLHLDRVQSR
jgi:hypothetical protein